MNNITAPNYFSWSPKSSYQLILNISTYLYCKHLHFDFESSFLVYGATWGSPFIPFLKKIGAKFYMKTVTSRTLRHAFKLSRVAKWEWNKFNANITFIQICIYYLLTTGGDWVKQVKNKLASIICLTCQRRREGTYHIQTMHSCGHRMPQMRLRSIAVLLRFYIFLQRSIWFC